MADLLVTAEDIQVIDPETHRRYVIKDDNGKNVLETYHLSDERKPQPDPGTDEPGTPDPGTAGTPGTENTVRRILGVRAKALAG